MYIATGGGGRYKMYTVGGQSNIGQNMADTGVVLRWLQGAQAAYPIVDCSAGNVSSAGQPFERVRTARVQVQFGRHPSIREAPCVGDVLIAEDVEVTGVEVGRRAAR